jgi:acyl carrier protein
VSEASLNEAVELIRRELAFLLQDGSIPLDQVTAESSLIEDLRLDSFSFVDLTLALERAFEIGEFPMQDWVDEEALKEAERFTLGALAGACLQARRRQSDRELSGLGDR